MMKSVNILGKFKYVVIRILVARLNVCLLMLCVLSLLLADFMEQRPSSKADIRSDN